MASLVQEPTQEMHSMAIPNHTPWSVGFWVDGAKRNVRTALSKREFVLR
jgi:hypothetical protein